MFEGEGNFLHSVTLLIHSSTLERTADDNTQTFYNPPLWCEQNEYVPAGPSASDRYWQDTAPGHHPYHQLADPWNCDGRHPSAFHDSAHGCSHSSRPRERLDRHESRAQPSVSCSQGRRNDNTTAQEAMGPTMGWGSDPAAGWGASEPW